jgi:hypothetical protein
MILTIGEGFMRLIADFLSYLIFLGSAYVMFATNFYFRYLLIPVTLFAFFHTIFVNFNRGIFFAENSAKKESDNIISGEVSRKE